MDTHILTITDEGVKEAINKLTLEKVRKHIINNKVGKRGIRNNKKFLNLLNDFNINEVEIPNQWNTGIIMSMIVCLVKKTHFQMSCTVKTWLIIRCCCQYKGKNLKISKKHFLPHLMLA